MAACADVNVETETLAVVQGPALKEWGLFSCFFRLTFCLVDVELGISEAVSTIPWRIAGTELASKHGTSITAESMVRVQHGY